MKYKIIEYSESGSEYVGAMSVNCSYKLAEEIEEKISDGWEPQGGVAIHCQLEDDGHLTMIYAQAMVKK